MVRVLALLLHLLLGAPHNILAAQKQLDDQDPTFWIRKGQAALNEALRIQPVASVAKNVIIFLGDGMGIQTIAAARTYKGQKEENPGEETQLSFEKFPYVALAKTYNVDHQVPDSAGTATAFLTGVKTNMKTIGVNAKARHNDCSSTFGNEVTSVLKWAIDEGKHAGFVTTTRVSHATPAALYAHIVNRDWESDVDIPSNSSDCKDISRQLVEDEPGRDIKVILGGGRKTFLSKGNNTTNPFGVRKDNRDLVSTWLSSKEKNGKSAKYVSTMKQLMDVDMKNTDFLLGLFNKDHMMFEADRVELPNEEPSIAEMTKAAIQMLQKGPKGFFLLVEGGRIDHAHHNSNAKRALEDTIAFEEAVNAALDLTSEEDTLIVVTADHSHVMTINGYPKRGNPILGIAGKSEMDNMTYTTLMYTNGPGYLVAQDGKRVDLTGVDVGALNYTQISAVPMKTETHAGEDVAVYARGPMAHLFHGVQEQNYIAHVMGYASCVGLNKDHCSGSPAVRSPYIIIVVFLVLGAVYNLSL